MRLEGTRESIESRHPEWKQATLDFAAAWCSRLGDVYGAPICRNGTIDWDRLVAGPGNDHLYRDRLHHFAFAPLLARASMYGAPVETDLLDAIRAWIASTTRSRSPDGYSGSLIVAYRIVALVWTHAFLTVKAGDPELIFEILRVLKGDIDFVARRLGTSFPNNHLLADGFVTWFAGMSYPEFAEADSWIERGEQIWLRELGRQIYEDGASFEHASHYHTMACEMAASYTILNQLNGRSYPPWVDARVRAMLHLHADMAGIGTRPFEYGDGVEDPLIPVGDLRHWGRPDYSGLLASMFGEGSRPAACRDDDEGVLWLAGGVLPAPTAKEERAALRCYPQGGLYRFDDDEAGTQMLFRTGPVDGVPVNPGHMHADLLSIQVHVGGVPMIVDAGTYTYRSDRDEWPAGSPRWRPYFMSAAAHNGMSIDGEDPLARGSGDFPGAPIRSRASIGAALRGHAIAWVEAQNRGDTAYRGHHRGVVQVRGHYHLIYDVPGSAATPAAVSFGLQFAAGTRLEVGRLDSIVARGDGATLSVVRSDNLLVDTIACGQESPLLGWVSPRYGDVQPAPMLRYKPRSDEGPFAMLLSTGASTASVEGLALGRGSYAFRVSTDRCVDHVLTSTGGGAEQISAWDICFVGKLLWLRTVEGLPRELRWLDGRSAAWQAQGLNVRANEPVSELLVQVSPAGTRVEGCPRDRLFAEWSGRLLP
jgi:hypothetical protein